MNTLRAYECIAGPSTTSHWSLNVCSARTFTESKDNEITIGTSGWKRLRGISTAQTWILAPNRMYGNGASSAISFKKIRNIFRVCWMRSSLRSRLVINSEVFDYISTGNVMQNIIGNYIASQTYILVTCWRKSSSFQFPINTFVRYRHLPSAVLILALLAIYIEFREFLNYNHNSERNWNDIWWISDFSGSVALCCFLKSIASKGFYFID